ncbi:hypothetical protein G7Y89_g14022 [Cudoniella acicularis]|uniref:Uncharacterized protein n=1 Tax=Cudoniella acicularis TaxID=354080 RepID=A0A8H4R7F0_9HELO|nr:hypothetical protein G7Y89_g14022 [Cudoniella acicularis]
MIFQNSSWQWQCDRISEAHTQRTSTNFRSHNMQCNSGSEKRSLKATYNPVISLNLNSSSSKQLKPRMKPINRASQRPAASLLQVKIRLHYFLRNLRRASN